VFDGNAIEENFGPGARLIPGGGERRFPISGLSPERPAGPILVTGSVSARDESEARLQKSFAASTAIEHDDSPPPAGGACAQPPG
jgi:hypothetical protein